MKPPESRVEEGANGCHLSWGRKRVARSRPGVAGPVQEASRRAMLRIVRVKGFQVFSVRDDVRSYWSLYIDYVQLSSMEKEFEE